MAFYEQSMVMNAASVVASVERVGSVFQNLAKTESASPLSDAEEVAVLDELQNIVVQAAALSRYFRPVRKNHYWRGDDLRKRFSMAEDSPLKSRSLRNELEHFDERLDDYLENGIVGHIIPHYIGPEPEPQQVPLHIFRAYYFDLGIFHLLGNRYEVLPLANEVYRVYKKLLASGHSREDA